MIGKLYHFILSKVKSFLQAADYNREKGSASRTFSYGINIPSELIAGFITFWILAFITIIVIILFGSLVETISK